MEQDTRDEQFWLDQYPTTLTEIADLSKLAVEHEERPTEKAVAAQLAGQARLMHSMNDGWVPPADRVLSVIMWSWITIPLKGVK